MSNKPGSARPTAAWAVAASIVVGIVLLFVLMSLQFLVSPWFVLWIGSDKFTAVVDHFVKVSGLSPYLVKGVVVLALARVAWTVADIVRFGTRGRLSAAMFTRRSLWASKRIAAGVIVVSLGSYSFATYRASWSRATAEIVVNLEHAQQGPVAKRLTMPSIGDMEYFDTLTRQPKVWYYQASDGAIELFSSPGRHPAFGNELQPITKDLVRVLQRDFDAQAATRIAAAHTTTSAAESDASAQRARYVNPITSEAAVVLILDSDLRVDTGLTDQVAAGLGGSGSVFRDAFVADGLFKQAYDGDSSVLRGLGLGAVRSVVFGIKQSSMTSPESVDKDLKRGETRIVVREYHPSDNFTSRSVTVDAIAPGFSDGAALQQADDAAAQHLLAKLVPHSSATDPGLGCARDWMKAPASGAPRAHARGRLG